MQVLNVRKFLLKSRQESTGNVPSCSSNDKGGQLSINDEIKRVLTMFSVPPIDWIELNDTEELYRVLINNERLICERLGCDYKYLKDLFNNPDLSLREKIKEILK